MNVLAIVIIVAAVLAMYVLPLHPRNDAPRPGTGGPHDYSRADYDRFARKGARRQDRERRRAIDAARKARRR